MPSLLFPWRVFFFFFSCETIYSWTHLGLSEEELQVSAAQDAVVPDVAREVQGAGAVHGAAHGAVDGAVDLHVAVDDVEVFLFVLEQNREIQSVYSSLKEV